MSLEELQNLVECPICCDLFQCPITTCSTGHVICNSCQKQTKSCPYCKLPYISTRNYPLEAILIKLTVPCVFAEHGCKFVTLSGSDEYSKLNEHLQVCEFG